VVVRVEVPAALLAWARDRSGISSDELLRRFPKLTDWESGAASPTLKQLENFAGATHTPVGYFFLSRPPNIPLPLPDFRTRRDDAISQPSPDLLDTIFLSEQRQEWYRDYARVNNDGQLPFVGSVTMATDVVQAARLMREALGFGVGERATTWSESFRRLADQAEELGVLVMVSGVVGSNTHRQLDPGEFLGFALVDEYAPAVFVNGASTKASQIFTLAHELVHIWLGQSALDDPDVGGFGAVHENEVERWCDQVAAEILVPLDALVREYRRTADLTRELDRLARSFKVSTLVILRRIRDAGYLDAQRYWDAYQAELARVRALTGDTGSGGNFYNTQPVRTSKRFARAIITSTLEGQTLYGDALQLLGFKKVSTLNELAQRLGVI
jgi:Zn-dependent peptidase ImmA (M78 family)/transcriptional regulator with XRE-family HTH domain